MKRFVEHCCFDPGLFRPESLGKLRFIGAHLTLCDEAKIRNRVIHLFVDCQSAIVSAFGISIPNYKVDNIEYQKINLSTGK